MSLKPMYKTLDDSFERMKNGGDSNGNGDGGIRSIVSASERNLKPVRFDGSAPRINKAIACWDENDNREAGRVVRQRLAKIEKGWLGQEYIKGASAEVLQLAKDVPASYLSVLEAIEPMQSVSIAKGFDVTAHPIAGLQPYSLEAPAKLLYPVLSPIRNILPRVGGNGESCNWAAVLAIDDNNVGIGLGTGQRGAIINQRVARFSVPYRSIGLENQATFEAQSAAEGFQDILALVVLQTMQALQIREEQAIIGGIGLPTEINGSSFALGQTPTPTTAASTTGGSLATGTVYVVCFALSLEGTTRVLPFTSGGNSVLANGATTVARSNADGTSTTFNAGFAKLSAQATQAVTGPTASITANVAAVAGAFGYVWGVSSASGGPYTVWGVTNTNTAVITNLGAGNCTIPADLQANDRSANAFIFDGLWPMALGAIAPYVIPTSISPTPYFTGTATMINQTPPYFLTNLQTLNGANLASNGQMGITQIDNMLQWMFDTYRFGPHRMFVHSSLQLAISNLILSGPSSGASLVRITGDLRDAGGEAQVSANRVVTNYNNPVNTELIKIQTHPYLTPGCILFFTERVPWPSSNAGVLAAIKAQRDYYAQEWPLRNRTYQYGVYSQQALACYFPPGFQAIMNVGSPNFAPSVTMPTQNLPANYQ